MRAEQARHQKALAELNNKLQTAQMSSEDLSQRLADFQVRIANLEREKSAAVAASENANRALNLEIEDRRQLAQTLDSIRDEIIKLQKQNSDLVAANNLLNQKLNVAEQKIRDLDAARVALQQENEELRQKLAVAGPGATRALAEAATDKVEVAAPPTPTVPIKGSVTGVEGNYASINVGEADGVKEGMSFIVYRGDKFLANLRIRKVEPNQSAGILTERAGDVRGNDQVMTAQ
jgi:hypothetical protein